MSRKMFVGVLSGYAFAKLISGKKAGEEGAVHSVSFTVKKKKVHIHHWLHLSVILVILNHLAIYSSLIYGLLYGMIAQGLTYSDRYQFIYPVSSQESLDNSHKS
ncbi:MAG TPA: hypothetical protein PKL83_00740 [bacterium]|nr:hypothetical protein [bacterium]